MKNFLTVPPTISGTLGKQSGFHQFFSSLIIFSPKKAFVELAFVYLEKGTLRCEPLRIVLKFAGKTYSNF